MLHPLNLVLQPLRVTAENLAGIRRYTDKLTAPATIMRVMNSILADYIGKFIWIYLDDIVIFSDTRQQHIQHLHQVFTTLRENKFYLNINM